MIAVDFQLEKGTDYYVWLNFCRKRMPWLNYLYENSNNLIIKDQFNQATYQNHVKFCFYLAPEKETFYRLKYEDGISKTL